MAFTEKDVDYIANLARLSLSPQETKQFTSQLDKILSYVHKLDELNTESVEPTAHILPVNNVFRADEPKTCPNAQYAVEQAPELINGLFSVPKVIE
ncbi:MAG: Asp-tRNA(Asn)/Glu-tRNA(Gln) amidotransferase subunit GatC [Candidatus Auribacter fodinae]|jgi:aspartyl-tRNA(Asn)/glutamyl-tRNA(Gln) amidotransferase subunit C|uniref:Aspartyl/glutamyl-tRNA(Asn/Gln) amidotransferase subunit C n=1 Tax=Candidatus Auribacter fodinae TaxID=2093366 RepID=A0A3A4R8Y9_9BACT|nr:MAG: Asp-tRNA(Asn)/Glu-tRNA(Gln) amidotransferase subunit GatC [Candidatus Auribacter fodinae]